MRKYNTATTASQPWMLALEFVEEPELVEAKRSSDGRWLKQTVSLETVTGGFSETKIALAGRSDYDDAEQLFAARR